MAVAAGVIVLGAVAAPRHDRALVARDILPAGDYGRIENGFNVAETEVGLLLYRCGHMVLRRDAELARAHQDAAARGDFHAVAVAGKRRPNAGWSDMFHGACILTGIRGR